VCPQQYSLEEYDGSDPSMAMGGPERDETGLPLDTQCNGKQNLHCNEKVCYSHEMEGFHGISDEIFTSDEEPITGYDKTLAHTEVSSTLFFNKLLLKNLCTLAVTPPNL
jgi:hypothetical protein